MSQPTPSSIAQGVRRGFVYLNKGQRDLASGELQAVRADLAQVASNPLYENSRALREVQYSAYDLGKRLSSSQLTTADSLSPVQISRVSREHQAKTLAEDLPSREEAPSDIQPPYSPFRNDSRIFGSPLGTGESVRSHTSQGTTASGYGGFYNMDLDSSITMHDSSKRFQTKKRVEPEFLKTKMESVQTLMRLNDSLGSSGMSTPMADDPQHRPADFGRKKIVQAPYPTTISLRDDTPVPEQTSGVRRIAGHTHDTRQLLDDMAPLPDYKPGKQRVASAPIDSFSTNPDKDHSSVEQVKQRNPARYTTVVKGLIADPDPYVIEAAKVDSRDPHRINNRITGSSLGTNMLSTKATDDVKYHPLKPVPGNMRSTDIFSLKPENPAAAATASLSASLGSSQGSNFRQRAEGSMNRANMSDGVSGALEHSYLYRVKTQQEDHVELGMPYPALGLRSGQVSASQLIVSSEYSRETGGNACRLRGESAWIASALNAQQFVLIDFGEVAEIWGIATQGSPLATFQYWVTEFKLRYVNTDGQWDVVKDFTNSDQSYYKQIVNTRGGKGHVSGANGGGANVSGGVNGGGGADVQYQQQDDEKQLFVERRFRGNDDGFHVVTHQFETPIMTQYLMIIPTAWNNAIALRTELFGRRTGVVQILPDPLASSTPNIAALPIGGNEISHPLALRLQTIGPSKALRALTQHSSRSSQPYLASAPVIANLSRSDTFSSYQQQYLNPNALNNSLNITRDPWANQRAQQLLQQTHVPSTTKLTAPLSTISWNSRKSHGTYSQISFG